MTEIHNILINGTHVIESTVSYSTESLMNIING